MEYRNSKPHFGLCCLTLLSARMRGLTIVSRLAPHSLPCRVSPRYGRHSPFKKYGNEYFNQSSTQNKPLWFRFLTRERLTHRSFTLWSKTS